MFVIKQSDTFKWPVVVELPADGGKTVKHTFDAEFRRVGKSELKTRFVGINEDKDADAVIRGVLVGWNGVNDGAEPVPFSEAALDSILDIPGVSAAILKAFTTAMSGEAARKN